MNTKMEHTGMTVCRKAILALGLAVALAGVSAGPALADDWHHGPHGPHGWHGPDRHEWHGHERWVRRHYYAPPPVVVVPPPQAVYVPPPVMVAPPPAAGLSIVLPINIR